MLVKYTLHSLYAGSSKCASYLTQSLIWQQKMCWLLDTVFMLAAESFLVTLHSLYAGCWKCASYLTVFMLQWKVHWLLYTVFMLAAESVLVTWHSFHAGKQIWWPFACVSGLMRHSHPSLWQQRKPTKHWRRKLTDSGVILLRWVVAVYVCVCVHIYECMQRVCGCVYMQVYMHVCM